MEISDPCCAHFDPSKINAAEYGGLSGEEYPFDIHLGFDSCWAKARGADADHWVVCEYVGDHRGCPVYTPSTHQLVRFVRVQRHTDGAAYEFYVLDKIRLSVMGFAEYRVYRWSGDDPDDWNVTDNVEVCAAANTMVQRDADTRLQRVFTEFVALASNQTPARVTKLPLTHRQPVKLRRSFLATLQRAPSPKAPVA